MNDIPEQDILNRITGMNYDRDYIFKEIIKSIKELRDQVIVLEGKNNILEEDARRYNQDVIKMITVGSNIGFIAPVYNGREFSTILTVAENVPFLTMMNFIRDITNGKRL